MKKWKVLAGITIVVLAIGAVLVFRDKDMSKKLKITVSPESFTLPYDRDMKNDKQVCSQMFIKYKMDTNSKYGTAENNTLCSDPPSQPGCFVFDKDTKVVVASKDSSSNQITLYGNRVNKEAIIAETNRLCF